MCKPVVREISGKEKGGGELISSGRVAAVGSIEQINVWKAGRMSGRGQVMIDIHLLNMVSLYLILYFFYIII